MVFPRKIWIVVAILGVLLVIFISYFFYQGRKVLNVTNEEENIATLPLEGDDVDSGEFSQLTLPVISRIADGDFVSPTLSDDGDNIYYFDQEKGDVYSVGLDGSGMTQISTKQFYGVERVEWSPQKDLVALTFEEKEGESGVTYIYDVFTKEITKLSAKISSVVFSPRGDEIAYQYYDVDNAEYSISVADADGQNFEKIKNFQTSNPELVWNEEINNIFIKEKASGLKASNIYRVDPTDGGFTRALGAKFNLLSTISPKANYVAYSATDGSGNNLMFSVSSMGGKTKPQVLNVFTLGDKAVWTGDERYIYVAVPQNLSRNNFNIRTYLSGEKTTNDILMRIDISSGEKVTLVNPINFDYIVDMRDMFLSFDEKLLFFRDEIDNSLYAINLEKAEEEAGVPKEVEKDDSLIEDEEVVEDDEEGVTRSPAGGRRETPPPEVYVFGQ